MTKNGGFMRTLRVVGLGLLSGAAMAAGSIDAGLIKYIETGCQGCHGTPPRLSQNGAAGINNPVLIKNAVTTQSQMRHLRAVLVDADYENIATYMGFPSFTDADCTFNWAEGTFASLLNPRTQSATISGFYYRFYSGTNIYVATKGSELFFLDARVGGNPQNLGPLSNFYNQAIAAGCV
jgi:hypothetical protein